MLLIPVKAKRKRLDVEFYTPKQLMQLLSFVVLANNIIFIVFHLGTDFVENRFAIVDMTSQVREQGFASPLFSIYKQINSMLPLLLVFSSKELLNKLMYGERYSLPIWALIPFSVVVLNAVFGGARSSIVHSLTVLIVGSMLFYNYQVPLKSFLKKGILIALFVFFTFSAYSTLVEIQRAKNYGNQVSYLFENPNLAFLNGVMEYSFWHILGYQQRMTDSFLSRPNGLGGDTFGFITNLTFPFSSQFGFGNNLGELLGVEKKRKTLTDDSQYRHITATVYFNLHDDLGYNGTFVAIFLFTFFTQILFRWLINSKLRHIIALALFLFVYSLWRSSWFQHILGTINFLSIFYPYLIYEFLISYIKKNKNIVLRNRPIHVS